MEQMPGPKEDLTNIFLLIHFASAITIIDIKLTRSGTRTLVWP